MTKRRDIRDERDESIARDAARRLNDNRASDIGDAVRQAAAHHDGDSPVRGLPSAKRIRQHAQFMAMQNMGEQAYRERTRSWLELAEDVMTTIEQALPDSITMLVGRAAEGHFDGDPALHVRMLAEHTIGEIAEAMTTFGYELHDATFPTMESRYGRLSQLQWLDAGGIKVTLTRCHNRHVFDDHRDLHTGKPVPRLSLSELRARLNS